MAQKGIKFGKLASIHNSSTLYPPIRLYGQVKVNRDCEIGKYTYVGSNTTIGAKTTIGNYCSIARGNEIAAANHPLNLLSTNPFQFNEGHFDHYPGYMDHSRIKDVSTRVSTQIGNDIWIGTRCFISQGVKIGTGAVIAAHSVVTKDVPPYAVVGGVPAKVIKYRFSEELIADLLVSEWWLMEPSDLAGFTYKNIPHDLKLLSDIKTKIMKKNTILLESKILNNFSGSIKGKLIFKLDKGYSCADILSTYTHVKLNKIDQSKSFKNTITDNKLSPKTYKIKKSGYNKLKKCFWLSLDDSDLPKDFIIAKDSCEFSLLSI